MPSSSRRSLYRIVYPLNERPIFQIGRFVYDVIDCSERGLRYEVKNRRVPSIGTPVSGTIRFRRGDETLQVTGEVIRVKISIVVLTLEDPGIPFGDILAEQRYLRSRGFSSKE